MFTGRVVEPGEPEFLQEDTDGAIALEEEERDTCPSCGYLKVWCRDPANQFNTFEVFDERCHVTTALDAHRKAAGETRDEGIQSYARFAPGKSPDPTAGLDLVVGDDDQGGADEGQREERP